MTAKTPTVDVTLAKAHTHAGKPHAAGATISVSPAVATWLRDQGIANTAEAAPKKEAK